MRSTARTWLQLFRAPNLFTVPGDPLVGFLLSSPALLKFPPRSLLPIIASLCFYAAGLLLNDLMDLEEDRAERPNRPLPSGAARASHVWLVTSGLTASGLAICALGGIKALLVGFGIVAAIAAYDCVLKKVPVAGVITMGLCRGLSVLLGAAFAGAFARPSVAAAIAVTIYIAAVTHLARYETAVGAPAYAVVLPVAGPLTMLALSNNMPPTSWFTLLLAAGMIASLLLRVGKKQLPLPPAIGGLIRVLLFVQAFYCLCAPAGLVSIVSACALIALWPVSRAVSKRFYAS